MLAKIFSVKLIYFYKTAITIQIVTLALYNTTLIQYNIATIVYVKKTYTISMTTLTFASDFGYCNYITIH